MLKPYTGRKDMDKGIEIHADIVNRALLDKNIYLGNALVALYIQCGAIARAREMFHELPQPDVVSWNTLIAGYGRVGDGREALRFMEQMRQEGFLPDAVTLVCSLKACGGIRSSNKGRQVHAEIITRDGGSLLDKNIILGTALLDMYMKCGDLRKAQQIFAQLPVHDVVCWNALIAGHAQHGHGEDALTCFHQMQCNDIRPNAVTFLSVLKACGLIGAIDIGKRIHHDLLRLRLLPNNIEVGNALMDMYAKCGALEKAKDVFFQLPIRNVVSWNTLITAYVQYGHGENALQCFDQMQYEGYSPDVVTFICILKACGCIGSAEMGEKIHAKIVRKGLLEKDALIGSALVDMYAKCGALGKAKEVFDQLPSQDLVSWGALIAGYAEHGHGDDALNCFDHMRQNGFSPDSLIFVCIIKACASIRLFRKGKEIHNELITGGFLEKDLLIGTALMDLYTKCGALAEAEWVFDKIQFRNTVMWNVLITGYLSHGHGNKSEVCFQRMQCEGVCQDEVTFAGILKALGSIAQIHKGKRIHAAIVGEIYLPKHNLVGNALMDMYAKCGDLTKVQEQFEQLQVRNVESWNVLITGYKQHGYCKEVLKRFQCMQCEGLAPNTVTFICILQTCGSIGAAGKGEEIHAEIVRGSLMAKNVLVGNALLDMYAKCGSAAKAQEVADQLPVQDVISWTALIAGYAHLGKDDIAISLFNSMLGKGVEPDAVVFTVVLSACSHSGLLDMGQIYFEMMSSYYGVIPTVQHHTCMVDLYGRAGHFDKAVAVINTMQTFDYLPVWSALLGACQNQQNLELGRQAFDNAVRLDDKHAAFYVCMRNIYAVSQCKD